MGDINKGKYYDKFLTVPNLFTMVRIASSIGIVSYLACCGIAPISLFGTASSLILPAWTVLTAASDFIDGFLARKLHQESKWGMALDPIADKILNWGVGLTLIAKGIMPLWPLVILARDITVGGWTIYHKYKDGISKNKEQSFDLSFSNKIKALKKGDGRAPTMPAKAKMWFQSLGIISTLTFGFGSNGASLIAPIMMGCAIGCAIPEAIAIKKKYYSKSKEKLIAKPIATLKQKEEVVSDNTLTKAKNMVSEDVLNQYLAYEEEKELLVDNKAKSYVKQKK